MKATDNKNEIFVVVDKNDKIIGYRTRGECHTNKSLIHRGVGVIVFNDKNEILLQKRSKTKDICPSFFEISTGGHVNKGETYKQSALRETQEEIGIKPKVKFIVKFLYEYEQETEMDVVFTATHNGPFNINNDEVESIQFVNKDSVKKLKSKLTPFSVKCFQELGIL